MLAAISSDTWKSNILLRPYGLNMGLNPVNVYKLLGFWPVGVEISLSCSCLICKFSFLLKLLLTNLEWSAPLFSHSLSFMHGGEFGNEHIFIYMYFLPYVGFDRFPILYLTFHLLGLVYIFSIPGFPTFSPLFSTPLKHQVNYGYYL